MSYQRLLITAGGCSLFAGITHLAIIAGGPAWYRFFGAGEGMAQMAEAGSHQPAIMTAGIALVLMLWGVFALSGAGLVAKLPLLRTALVAITSVYLLRAFAGFTLPFFIYHPAIQQNSISFWLISSSICLIIGLLHLFGTIGLFHQINQRN